MSASSHIPYLRSGILCLVLSFSAATLPAADNSIPWNQLGAKAGADYQGDGLSVTPTDSGAHLHCVFQRLDGDATPQGLWLSSTVSGNSSDRFRVTAIEISRKAAAFPPLPKGEGRGGGESNFRIFSDASTDNSTIPLPATGNVTISGQTIRFTRPNLVEEYSVSMDGLRQDFIIPEPPDPREASWTAADSFSPSPPLGERAGERWPSELIVTLSVTGARVEPAPDGATLILENSGRRIAYNRLRVTDATGKQLPARIEASSPSTKMQTDADSIFNPNPLGRAAALPLPKGEGWGEGEAKLISFHDYRTEECRSSLSILINDTGAIYPLRIDPTFSDANWVSMGGVNGADGGVYAAVIDGSGNLYIGGQFTVVGNIIGNNVAKWNGSSWSPLGSGINGAVSALAVLGGTLYAGGGFTNAGGIAVNYIAQWNGSSWSALGTGVGGSESEVLGEYASVNALAASGGTLYVGGNFTNAGGVAANDVAQWDGTNWSALGSGIVGGEVYALTVSSNGTLYAGGILGIAGGTSVSSIAQWDGSTWSGLGSGIVGQEDETYVYALAVSGDTLYVGGRFTSAGGNAASCIAQWDGTNWSALGAGMGGERVIEVYSLAVSGGTLYAGGNFTTADGNPANYIAEWNGNSWSQLGSGTGDGDYPYNPYVYALAASGTNVYAGGGFTTAGNAQVYNIAQWNGSSWSPMASGTGGTDSPIVDALAVSSNGTLYAAGEFTTIGGTAANYVAQWNGSSWSALGPGVNNVVSSLAVSGNTLYAGGAFTNVGGVAANYIAQWDGTNWSPLGSGMSDGDSYGLYVGALAVSGGKLYAAGDFTNAGAITANNIAQWDGTNWSPLGSGFVGSLPYANALAVSGSNLYAGGFFTNAGGIPVNYIAQWNGSNWLALGPGISSSGAYVEALAVSGNNLYVGGYFTNAGGVAVDAIARWNGSNWSALGSGMTHPPINSPVYGTVFALTVSPDRMLYAGGEFTAAGGIPANYIAQWDGNKWSALGSGMNALVAALTVSSDNILYAGGYFTTAGTNVSAYVAQAILTTDGNFGFTNGYFGFDVAGPPGSNVLIQTSTDLQNWTTLQTNQFNNLGLLYFSDSQSPITTQRFYQAVLP